MTVNMLLVNITICLFFNIIGLDDSENFYKVRYLYDVARVMGVCRNFRFPLATPLIIHVQ